MNENAGGNRGALPDPVGKKRFQHVLQMQYPYKYKHKHIEIHIPNPIRKKRLQLVLQTYPCKWKHKHIEILYFKYISQIQLGRRNDNMFCKNMYCCKHTYKHKYKHTYKHTYMSPIQLGRRGDSSRFCQLVPTIAKYLKLLQNLQIFQSCYIHIIANNVQREMLNPAPIRFIHERLITFTALTLTLTTSV